MGPARRQVQRGNLNSSTSRKPPETNTPSSLTDFELGVSARTRRLSLQNFDVAARWAFHRIAEEEGQASSTLQVRRGIKHEPYLLCAKDIGELASHVGVGDLVLEPGILAHDRGRILQFAPHFLEFEQRLDVHDLIIGRFRTDLSFPRRFRV